MFDKTTFIRDQKLKKMKKIIFSTLVMAIVLTACNSKNKETTTPEAASGTAQNDSQLYACSMHPEVTGKKGDRCSKCGMELTEPVKETTEKSAEVKTTQAAQGTFSINEIVSNYLTLKNALTKDDTKGAANAGKALYAIFNSVNPNSIDAKLKTEYLLDKLKITEPVKVEDVKVISRLGFVNKAKGFTEVKRSDEQRNKITGAYE